MKNCIFCKIISGDESAEILFENADCIAISPLEVEVNDHLVIIPKKHVKDIFSVSPHGLNKIIAFTKEVSENLKEKYSYTGVNILHASGKSAQQSVDHFHIHILPRKESDMINAWPKLPGGNNTIKKEEKGTI